MSHDCGITVVYPADRNEAIKSMCEQLVDTCISCYDAIQTQMLPTPAKCHYTFNLRDLSKVFQGILMADSTKIEASISVDKNTL